jgi:hypothetical protein
MFYACDVMVSSFVSFVLCYAPSHTCLYFVLFLLIFIARICVCPPLSACLSVRCKLMCHLHAGNSWKYVACECVLVHCVLFVLLMKLGFGPHNLVPLLWRAVSILSSPSHFVGLVSFETTCVTLP